MPVLEASARLAAQIGIASGNNIVEMLLNIRAYERGRGNRKII
jgi:hypothetical protein